MPPPTPSPNSGASRFQGESVRIYHNPQCIRSREALEYLQQQGIQPEVIDFLASPPTIEELRELVRLLGIAPSSLIRPSDFRRLNLTPTSNYEKLLQLIAQHPVLMERPIVVVGSEARIGRPIENLYELFSSSAPRRKG